MYKSIPTSYSVFYAKGDGINNNPIYGDSTHISIEDESGGGFIVVAQHTDDGKMEIRLDKDEIEEVLRIANKLLTAYDAATKEYENG
ncbi:MAG: hypothetical protein EOM23_08610 [Candidatus Moranbacteria bacterium]|nr:hypothetical protein [Candidatus Moranbacteria bacterium]